MANEAQVDGGMDSGLMKGWIIDASQGREQSRIPYSSYKQLSNIFSKEDKPCHTILSLYLRPRPPSLICFTVIHLYLMLVTSNMTDAPENDPFEFNIQLNTDEAGRGFHRFNDGDEIQRPDIVDNLCLDLLLQARIDRIIHGTEMDNGNPATLVVFGFRFHGINEKRRFKEATILITFQDAEKKPRGDPEVIGLWPNGDFTLGEVTEIDIDNTTEQEVGADAKIGSGAEASTHATFKWERKQSYKKTDRSTLTGSIILNTAVRKYGPNNAIRLTISENTAAVSGIVTDIRAAVLLRRKINTDCFLATVKMKAKAHFLYNAVNGIRSISGLLSANDPIKFKPGEQYMRPATLSTHLEEKLAEKIDESNLSFAKLDGLAGVLGTTALAVSM